MRIFQIKFGHNLKHSYHRHKKVIDVYIDKGKGNMALLFLYISVMIVQKRKEMFMNN